MAPKVLFVLTSYDKLPSSDKPTGWYLPEFAHPYEVLAPQAEITVASPKGGIAPLDPASVEATKEDPISVNFLQKHESLWKDTVKLSDLLGHAKDYEAIFYVGGHGPMFDLATDEDSHALINEFYTHNKIISAVCHGPAALTHVKLSSGGYLLDSQPVTGFSNAEEDMMNFTKEMPFSLEVALNKSSGGKFVKAEKPWASKVVVARGGRLITGQNPASAAGVGEAIYEAIFGDLTQKAEV